MEAPYSTYPPPISGSRVPGPVYRQLFERSPVPQLFVDSATRRITGANGAAGLFYGYRCEELVGVPLGVLSALPEERLACRLDQVARGERTSFHAEHRLRNGSACAVEVHATPVETDAGPRLHLLIHDVTPSLLAREAVERSGRLLNAILHSAPLIVFIVGRDERFRLAVGVGLKALPHRRILGRTVSELYAAARR